MSLSIVVPTRNERNYIENLVQRIVAVQFNFPYEIIFIEGHSQDGTLEEIKRVVSLYDRTPIVYAIQNGIGKADAVWKGFEIAKNEILIILDADLTVQPEDLPRFCEAAKNSNTFVNGSRLIYKMEKGAMRPLNYLGNRAFAIFLSVIIGRKLTDTLCGTKLIYKDQFQKIKKMGLVENLKDPFCDFTLLLGARKLGLDIIEVPVTYKKRIYGGTKIRRFRDGWRLLNICFKYIFAA